MSPTPEPGATDHKPEKTVAPPLTARAQGPRAVRIRKPIVHAAVLAGALLLSGSLAWAFVVQPELRREVRDRTGNGDGAAPEGPVRPAEAIAAQPGRYDRLPSGLPRPRGSEPKPAPQPATSDLSAAAPVHPAPWRPDPPDDALTSAARQARASGLFFADAGRPSASEPAASAEVAVSQAASPEVNPHRLRAPVSPYELKAGAIVPGLLLTALDTSRPGPVVAVVSRDVFDTVTGRHLLIPRGARLIGRHEGESVHGDRRAFLAWERLILPNGSSLQLDQEPGVDAQGAIGVRGETDRRLWPLAVASLFSGAITTLGEFARGGARDEDRGSLLGNAGDAAALQAAEVGGRLIDRELEVRTVVRVPAGAAVRVLITRDLVLEPYRR